MSNIVRVWKEDGYRLNLTVEEWAALPANPAGEIELTEEELETISGAFNPQAVSAARSFALDSDNAGARTQQIVTFQPVLGGPVTVIVPIAPQCNNIASPASSSANLFDFF